jgi:uncharacterized protein
MLGPLVNSAALLFGGGAGAALGSYVPKRVTEALPLTCGVLSACIGTVMVSKVHALPPVALAMLGGSFIGELLSLEKRLEALIRWCQKLVERFLPPREDDPKIQSFILKYVSVLVLFSVSGMGVFGSMREGMSGDPTILLAKSVLDLFTALIFGAEMGFSIMLIALPQIAIQGSLYFGATFLAPLVSMPMQLDFSACGGIIMFATGLRICGIKLFPIVNMLPALILAMPASALWSHFF